jgi:hypothetical protein
MCGDWRKGTHQKEGEDNAADKEPFARVEGNEDAAIGLVGTLGEDLVGPVLCGQHGDGGEDIGHVDGEGLEEDEEEEDVLGAHLEAIVPEVGDGDEVKLEMDETAGWQCELNCMPCGLGRPRASTWDHHTWRTREG